VAAELTDRGLLVDFGGVLTTSIWDAFDAFCRAEGLEEGAVKDLFRSDPEALADLRRLETGNVEPGEFERSFGARLGLEASDGLIDRLFAALGPDERMVEAVRTARSAGARTGLVSNSWGTSIYSPELLEGIFDDVVISGEVGLHKPQPEIFHLACERLKVEPSRCVFVDDLRENVAGAESVGMTAVLHRDTDATLARLEELLGLELR
jgi:epoxide hydrolase-like predicted phosphatase